MIKRLTIEQKDDLISKYKSENYLIKDLAKEFNTSSTNIIEYTQRLGIYKKRDLSKSNRKYNINDNYFDVIDNERKAYWLGFLYADGCNNINNYNIAWSLQYEDIDILEKFKIDIETNRPIHKIEKRVKNPNWKDLCIINITNKNISLKLNELGMIQAKSLILKFPTEDQVPNHLLKHFIRGYFDGDGCSTIYKLKGTNRFRTCVSFVSTLDFCLELDKFIKQNVEINTNMSIRHKTRNNSTRTSCIGGNGQTVKFLDWLYYDCEIYLQRKFEKYQLIKRVLEKCVDEEFINYSEFDLVFENVENNQKFSLINKENNLVEYEKLTSTTALNLNTSEIEYFYDEFEIKLLEDQ